MRIRKLWLDGYGRFSNRELDLHPGLQIIVGPNEQGKSTTRCFVGDMLYGQKRSGQFAQYDENHEVRRPWDNPDAYGGRLAYELDDGRRFEVHRSFDSTNEYARIYDSERGHEVTSEFEQLPNREPAFAEGHLGLSREVFLSAATLSHLTLEGLGDANSLSKIRERLMALTDSGSEMGSARTAIERLQARIALIGRRDNPKRPLPAARTRLQDLQKEYEEAFHHQQQIQAMEDRRREALRSETRLRQERREAERELEERNHWERRKRLNEAESLLPQIDRLTQRCFELSSVREFPLDALHDVQRLEIRLSTARAQLTRSDGEYEQLQQQLTLAADAHGEPAPVENIPPELEERLAEVEVRMKSLGERRRETESERQNAQQRVEALQKSLAGLPDFSRISSDPVEWLTQIASSFTMARRVFEEEANHYQTACEHAEWVEREIAPLQAVIGETADLGGSIRDYNESVQRSQQATSQAQARIDEHRFLAQEYESASPEHKLLSFLSGLFTVVLSAAGAYTGNRGAYIPAALCGVLFLWFIASLVRGKRAAKLARSRAQEAEREIEQIAMDDAAVRSSIEELMDRGGCQAIRELEAMYESYLELEQEQEQAQKSCKAQERKALEAREHVNKLFNRLVTTFQQVGESLRTHDDVADAVGRAIARYQEYRETKRRIADARDHLGHIDQHHKRLKAALQEMQEEYDTVSIAVRRIMRAHGYDEAKHDSPSSAVRAYKVRVAEGLEQQGRTSLLRQQCRQLEEKRASEKRDLLDIERELHGYLEDAAVDSLESWHALAGLAREYQETRAQLAALEDRVASLLQGATIEAARESVAALGAAPEVPLADAEQLRTRITALSESIAARQEEAYDLQAKVAAERACSRPLHQIEEERAELMRQVQELELELQAASYAIALIEETARRKHALTAPQLGEAASGYLSEITGGRYGSVAINGNFEIQVRIPQRNTVDAALGKRLSKGTVDQVYLALRLAMVQTLSRNGERIPMILDDPFANYDDKRLERTMKLLVRVAKQNQILLFTCREDVAAAGQKLQVPVIGL